MTTGFSPLIMARAYSAFANGGYLPQTHFIRKIVDATGKTVVDNTDNTKKRIIKASVAKTMTSMMLGTFKYGTGVSAALMVTPLLGKLVPLKCHPVGVTAHAINGSSAIPLIWSWPLGLGLRLRIRITSWWAPANLAWPRFSKLKCLRCYQVRRKVRLILKMRNQKRRSKRQRQVPVPAVTFGPIFKMACKVGSILLRAPSINGIMILKGYSINLKQRNEAPIYANVYDTANQLASDLKESQQFKEMQHAFDMLKLDAVAYAMFQQFQQKQMALQQKQMQGQQPTEDEIKDIQTIGEKMQNMQPINDLMVKEQALSQMMDELNRAITQPIVDIYQGK